MTSKRFAFVLFDFIRDIWEEYTKIQHNMQKVFEDGINLLVVGLLAASESTSFRFPFSMHISFTFMITIAYSPLYVMIR